MLKGKRNKAMADQLTTISKMRLMNQIGKLPHEDMWQVERAVKVHLGLSEKTEGNHFIELRSMVERGRD
jgi:mRNA interferase MazF